MPIDQLNKLVSQLEDFERQLKEVEEKQKLLFEFVLKNGDIKPGAVFEVLTTQHTLCQTQNDKNKKKHILIKKGQTIMFVGVETRNDNLMYDWLIEEKVTSIHPGNIVTNIGLVKTGGSNEST